MATIDIKDALSVNKKVKAVLEPDNETYIPKSDVGNVRQFTDGCMAYPSASKWTVSLAANDLLLAEGGTAGAYWWDFSLDPFVDGTESKITSVQKFPVALEAVFGLSASQRSAGQEMSVELVDADTAVTPAAALTISSIQQTTTVVTVVTTTSHELKVGDSISIYNVTNDSRLNYCQLTVASIVSATSFTASTGPESTIPSLSIGPFTTGNVIQRSRVGWRANGTSMILDNTSATNASFYTVSNSGNAKPSGTLVGDHNASIATSASVQLTALAFAGSFVPTSEYRLLMLQDRLNWSDVAINGMSGTTNRGARTLNLPSPEASYKVQFRLNNCYGKPTVVGRIVTAVKAGGTTATVTTDVPHTLTTGDYVAIYGSSLVADFPNIVTATVVASIVSPTVFTIVWPNTAGTTGYGGIVYRCNGNTLPSQIGIQTTAATSVSRTSNVLTLNGTAAWTSILVGEIVNLHGCMNLSGVSLGVDGSYRVDNMVTTALTLTPVGSAPTGADIGLTNCGGALARRTSFRIHSVRAESYDFVKVECSKKALGDASNALPISLNYSNVNQAVVGTAAHDAAITSAPVRLGGRALTANYTAVSTGDVADLVTTLTGSLITRDNCIPEQEWSSVVTVTDSASNTLKAAAAAGIRNYLTGISYQNTNGTATVFSILDGASVLKTYSAAANMEAPVYIPFRTAPKTTAATALNVQAVTTGSNLIINCEGYIAP